MTEAEAEIASQRIAERSGVTLGDRLGCRGAGADPNSSYWWMLFDAPGCPPGVRWLTNVNDRGEDEVIIACIRNVFTSGSGRKPQRRNWFAAIFRLMQSLT